LRETIVPGETGTSSGMGMAGKQGAMSAAIGPGPRTDARIEPIEHPRQPEAVLPLGKNTEGWTAAYSPDGKTLVTSGSSGVLMRWEVGKLPSGGEPLASSSPVDALAFSPDGKLLATGSWDHTISLWNADGNQIAQIKGHDEGVRSVAFSPDGKLLASGSWDKTVKIWDVVTRKELRTISAQSLPINAVAFSPDGKALATGSGDWRTESPGEVELWDPATGKRIGNAWHSPREVKALAFSPAGEWLAVAHAASRAPGGDGGVVIQ